MDLITLDWETYYDKEYSLSRMSTLEYVSDPRFEIIMVGIKVNDVPADWHSFDSIEGYREVLDKYNVRGNSMICHNTLFDALILSVHFDIVPAFLMDTMALAQAVLKPVQRSISLANCLKALNLGVQKGTYVANMLGRRRGTLTSTEMANYGQYCVDDCEGEYALLRYLAPLVTRDEMEIIDTTLRMYLEPKFELDAGIMQAVYDEARAKKKALIAALPSSIKKTQLTSNPQLAKLLEEYGVEVPMKVSPTTNLPTYAFAKTDPGWKDLEEEYEDDPLIGPILAARLGVKSNLAESRAERLLDIANRHGTLRVPLRYYAAHTGRYGGMEKINCQNFTRIDPKNPSRSQLRYGLRAPDGYSVLTCDLSQIEVRVNAWLSGCNALLSIFRKGGDPYCEFASEAFRRQITKADQKERFIGKTCILGLGYGMGWKKLQATLRKDGIKITEQEACEFVAIYRGTYQEIPAMWDFCGETINIICHGGTRFLGPCRAERGKIILPNNMALTYHNLRWIESKKYSGWTYDFAGMGRTLWGGKIVENVVQSLSRIIIMGMMLEAKRKLKLKIALQAHDELVYIVPTPHVKMYEHHLLKIMRTPPTFGPDIPIDAEASYGPTYGDAK